MPGIGFLVGGFQEGLNNLIFGDNAFHRLRAREGQLLGPVADSMFSRISSASTPAELQSAVGDPGWVYGLPSNAAGVFDNGRIRVTGTHLEGLGGLESALTNAAGRQAQLLSAAAAGDPEATSLLAVLREQGQQRHAGNAYLNQHIPALAGSQTAWADPRYVAGALVPTITDWMEGRDRMFAEDGGAMTSRVQQSDQHLADLLGAAAAVGLSPDDLAQAFALRAQADEEEHLTQANASRSAGG